VVVQVCADRLQMIRKPFLKRALRKFPRLEHTVKVGQTGYPDEPVFREKWGVCFDRTGRQFVITPNYYVFQRYAGNGALVICPRNGRDNWNIATDKKQLSSFIKAWKHQRK
jgi:hypothetical protein